MSKILQLFDVRSLEYSVWTVILGPKANHEPVDHNEPVFEEHSEYIFVKSLDRVTVTYALYHIATYFNFGKK